MKLANGSDHPLHMILVAAWVILLKKYTRNNDIIVGTTILKQKQVLEQTRLQYHLVNEDSIGRQDGI